LRRRLPRPHRSAAHAPLSPPCPAASPRPLPPPFPSPARSAGGFLFAGAPTSNFTWSAGPSGGPSATAGVVKLRVSATELRCYYFSVSGADDKRKLTVVTLGGANANFATQCDPASYAAIPDVATKPFCASPPGSRAPLSSTVLQEYNYKGKFDSSSSSSGAEGAALALAAAAAAIAALAAAL